MSTLSTLHKGFELVTISVSFCDLSVELNTQDLVKLLRCHLFQDIFKMAGLAPASEDVCSFTVLWSRAYFDYTCLFTATDLSSCIISVETTEDPETSIFLRWLWICCCVVFTCLCFFGLGIIRILSRCWLGKNRQNIHQNGHWKLETSLKVSRQPEAAHNRHSETVNLKTTTTTSNLKFWQ